MNNKLGTFYGVFTPTLLTILGVIMYLRFGWLVGNLGLVKVIPIVLLANMITLITTLSFSAFHVQYMADNHQAVLQQPV